LTASARMFNQHTCCRQRAVRPTLQTDVCGSFHWSFQSDTKSVKKYKTNAYQIIPTYPYLINAYQ